MTDAVSGWWYVEAMGWLRNLRDGATERVVRDPHFERNVAAWKRWASEQGWTYQAEAPELVGRYEPEFRPDYHPRIIGENHHLRTAAERYYHLLTTQLHGLRATAFERRIAYADWQGTAAGTGVQSHVTWFQVLELPGLPPEEFVKMGAKKAIRKLGGDVPGNYDDVEFVGAELVARRYRELNPRSAQSLQFTAELMALQVVSLPGSFWRPTSSSGGLR